MKFSVRLAGFTLLGVTYAVSSFLVFRHVEHDVEPGRVTIRIAQWQLESGVREAFNAIIKRYEQINPHVHVVQIAVPGGPVYMSWVQTQMAGETAPDMLEYTAQGPDIGRHFQPVSADVMQPNPYNRGTPLEGVIWRDTIVDGMTGVDSFNPQLHEFYGIPMVTNASRLVYNVPLLEKITGRTAPPTNYRDLLAICAKVRAYAADHKLNLVPVANSRDTYELLSWMIMSDMTTKLFERIDFQHRLKMDAVDEAQTFLQKDWSYDSPEVVAALEELKEYGSMCTPGFWQRERDTAVTDFVTERSVMIVAPSWEASNLLALCKFKLDAFNFPYPLQDDPVYGRYAQGPYCDGQLIPGLPIYLNRDTRHRAESIDFLRFMSSVEGSTIFTNVSNWPPATIGVKPSPFASKFKYNPNGYTGGNFLLPDGDIDSQWYIQTHYPSLWNADGSVSAFRDVLRTGVEAPILSDLRRDLSSNLDNLRREDTAAAGRYLLGGRTPPEVLSLFSIFNESKLYQTDSLIKSESLASPGPDQPAAGSNPAAAGPSTWLPSVSLRGAWQQLAGYHAVKALPLFDARMRDSDPAIAREARFGHAVAILDEQPVAAEQIDDARRIFSDLAAHGSDDLAQGSLFFLGRIAQIHRRPPDAVEAARQYRALIATYPNSVWAQSALGRLALLEVYALDPASSPRSRIAAAEKLLDQARNPTAECEVQTAIANGILFYRLPAQEALPHLLASERTSRLGRESRTEVVAQIAELSRLGGDKAQAAAFYRTFLKENPIDFRDYLIRERLAKLERPQ